MTFFSSLALFSGLINHNSDPILWKPRPSLKNSYSCFSCRIAWEIQLHNHFCTESHTVNHCFFHKYVKWFPVYQVVAIFGDHVTVLELRVKVTLLLTYLQTKRRLDPSCFNGQIETQTRVPPLSSPIHN